MADVLIRAIRRPVVLSSVAVIQAINWRMKTECVFPRMSRVKRQSMPAVILNAFLDFGPVMATMTAVTTRMKTRYFAVSHSFF